MGGGGYDSPSVQETPTKEATKSVSAGATAAAEAQKQKAKKNRGLVSSIMTTRGGLATNSSNSNAGKTLG